MKTKTPVASLGMVFLLTGKLAFAATETPITNVVLYPGSATLERTAHVAPAMTQIELKNLPANFDMRTLRVDADTGIHIGNIVTQETAREQSEGPRQAEMEARIQALEDQKDALDNEIRTGELIRTYLEHLGDNRGSGDKQPVDGKSLSVLLDAMKKESADAFGQVQHAEIQKRDIEKKIDALNRDLSRIRNDTSDQRDIVIQFVAQKPGNIRISYQVGNAGWRPAYRASLDSASSTVRLERMGTIYQKTGQDWTGVKVKLSTGHPSTSPEAAEPMPWRITYSPPQPVVTTSSLQRSRNANKYGEGNVDVIEAEDVGKMPDKNVAESLQRIAPVEIHYAFTTEFEAPAPVNLPADGREISIPLSKSTLPVTQRIRVAPRMSKSAVLTAEAQRPEGVWVPGDIQLFRDGSYVGASRLETDEAPGFVFPFGQDDLIQVKIDHGKNLSGTTGLLSRQAERKVSDTYTITSAHKTPVDLLVLESSPVSGSDEVKVETAFAPQPGKTSWNERQGVMAWEKHLAPGESFKIHVDYTVSYPKEGSTSGLP